MAERQFSPAPSPQSATALPGCRVEVLIPDFRGDWSALETVLAARPDVLNHNIETVPRLYRRGARRRGLRSARSNCCGARETAGPGHAGQNRHDAGPRRNARRSAARHGRSRRARHRHLHAWVNICSPRASICQSCAYVHPDEFAEFKQTGRSRWDCATSKPARWCAPPITPSSKKKPPVRKRPDCCDPESRQRASSVLGNFAKVANSVRLERAAFLCFVEVRSISNRHAFD